MRATDLKRDPVGFYAALRDAGCLLNDESAFCPCPEHDGDRPPLRVSWEGGQVTAECPEHDLDQVCVALTQFDADAFNAHLGNPSPRKGGMRFFDMAELRARVAHRPARFLIEGLWPEDAYGVAGAEDKAGKTWALTDLGVSVATGTKWLDRFDCSEGPVLLLYGEGGDRNLLRRLDAICRAKSIDRSDLDGLVRVALAVPRLNNRLQVSDVAEELTVQRPRAVLLDPLYLAASGGKGRDLYAMGESLGAIQEICQEAGAALVVTTHWNQRGEGTGASRFTGAGPSAWGRVLASASVEQRQTAPNGRSIVTLLWEFTGGEIADTRFRMQRRVWVDDPTDLTSPMHYEVEVTDEGIEVVPADLTETQDRTLAALRDRGTRTVKEIGDTLAADGRGYPLKARTIQKALAALAEIGLVDSRSEEGKAGEWWAT